MQKLLGMELMYEKDSSKVRRVDACGGGSNDKIGGCRDLEDDDLKQRPDRLREAGSETGKCLDGRE